MERKVVADIIEKRNNNLSLCKFIAACLVIVSHAYPLTLGKDSGDFLVSLSNGQLGLGGLAVGVFFFSSGLFIARSVQKNQTAKKYFYARSIRIFPPLVIVILISIVILGLFFSSLDFLSYILNPQTWLYALNILLIPIHALPGVFDSNVYGNVVNGALWTLPVEFICYIALFIAYKLKILTKKFSLVWAALLGVIFLGFNYLNNPLLQSLSYYIQPVMLFGVGVLFYIFKEDIIMDTKYGMVCLLLFVVSVVTGFARMGQIIFFPYCFMCLIMAGKQCSSKVAVLGNFSYGIYLVGFPIQQALVTMSDGKMSVYANMLITIVIASILGICVYYLAERPLIRRQSKITRDS